MKANELKIGSFVIYENVLHVVHALYVNQVKVSPVTSFLSNGIAMVVYETTYDELYGVTLTPEILEQFGFKKQPDYLGWYELKYKNSSFEFSFGDTIESFELDYKQLPNNEWIGFKIPYLHQLQNLYFALTGEELIYTP